MRLVMFDAGFGPRFGALLEGERVLDLPGLARHVADVSDDPRDAALPALVPDDSIAFLRLGPAAKEAAEALIAQAADPFVHPRDSLTLLPPVLAPEKIIGIGLNYKSHAEEQGAKPPQRPLLFAKWNNALVGAAQPIVIPAVSREVDYEAELAVVVGRRAKNVAEEDALHYVAGYTVANDVSARDIQLPDRQWVRGKSPDTFSPLGPALVTPDEIPDVADLRVRLWRNDELLQDGHTAMLIFGVAHLISFISHSLTLQPGDVILTGTPDGVGFTREPPVFLQPGDRVRVEISGLGELDNPVVAEGT